MLSRALRVGTLVFAVLSPLAAAPAQAAALPAHAEILVDTYVGPAAFRQLVASRYQVEFIQVVAADIDRDGDIDVLATTDHTFTVWLNDGAGHLTRQMPVQPKEFGAGLDAPWLGEHRSNSFVSIQNDSQVVYVVGAGPGLSLLAKPNRLELSASAVSASPGALRPRSPPISPRLS